MKSRERAFCPDGHPQPFVIVDSEGKWSFDKADLIECGYTPTGQTGHVGLGRCQSIAHEMDVTMSSLQAWRLSTGTWEYFLIPGWTKGFCGSPLLGF